MNDKEIGYIDIINDYQKKLLVLQHITYHNKIAINDNNELYIQYKTPWRYIVRKIKNQNRSVLSAYLSNIINEYIKVVNIIIDIYNLNKHEIIKKLLFNIIDFISRISCGIIFLRNYYNLKNDSYQISLTLESINNKLNSTLVKIKLIV